MPTVIPNTASKKIQFFTTHLPIWSQDPPAIGTTVESVQRVQEELDAVQAAFNERAQAVMAARSATLRLKTALAKLDKAGAGVVGAVKATAKVGGDEIFIKASIRKPAKPSPIGKPGKTSQLAVTLLSNGSLGLKWKCKHPRRAKGTMYQVWRSLGIDGESVFLGTTGKKKFTDQTIPAGTPTVCYRITAVRSTARGETAEFPVNLGVNGTLPETVPYPGRPARIAA